MKACSEVRVRGKVTAYRKVRACGKVRAYSKVRARSSVGAWSSPTNLALPRCSKPATARKAASRSSAPMPTAAMAAAISLKAAASSTPGMAHWPLCARYQKEPCYTPLGLSMPHTFIMLPLLSY